MICLATFVENYREACKVINIYGEDVSIVELRCDKGDEKLLAEAAAAITRPLIITCRPRDHGGLWPGSEAERARFLERSLRHRPLYLDVELGSAAEELIDRYPDQQMILSFHGSADSNSWADLLKFAFKRGADTVKFVPQSMRWKDNLKILELIASYNSKGKRVIGHCSGSVGVFSRILAPAHGSMLTYCCASRSCPTSVGQFTIEETFELYRLPSIRRTWRVYGIAGSPVSHSRSPHIMNRAFSSIGIDAVYVPFDVEDFSEFITFARDAGIAGLSVTAPHKKSALESAIQSDEVAKTANSANTLVWSESGYLAHNTDGHGFIAAIEKEFGPVAAKKILLLGAGGASRAVAHALKTSGATVFIAARNDFDAKNVANELGIRHIHDPEDEPDLDVIINGTTVRLQEEDSSGLLQRWIRPGVIYVDLNYSTEPTWFLKEAERLGCKTLDGLPMLLAQAERQFKIWTGIDTTFTPEDAGLM